MIHLKPIAGLCNRMRALDSGIALSRTLDLPLQVYWVRNTNLNCPFHLLFESLEPIHVVVHELQYPPLRFAHVHYRFCGLMRTFGFNKQSYGILETKRLKQLNITNLNRQKPVYIQSYARFHPNPDMYRNLKPIPKLQEEIADRIKDFSSHTIGIHVRRTDHARAIQYSPDELFISRMHQEVNRNPKTTFYLATDSMDVKRKFIAEFGDRIMTTSAEASRTSIEGVQEALVELYALSKTKRIFGSYWSSYSHTASELGGIELTRMSTGED